MGLTFSRLCTFQSLRLLGAVAWEGTADRTRARFPARISPAVPQAAATRSNGHTQDADVALCGFAVTGLCASLLRCKKGMLVLNCR